MTAPRAIYCDPKHRQRAACERARARYRRTRHHARTIAAAVELGYRDSAWRRALRDLEPERVAAAIFGVEPAPVVRHGDTLDAQ